MNIRLNENLTGDYLIKYGFQKLRYSEEYTYRVPLAHYDTKNGNRIATIYFKCSIDLSPDAINTFAYSVINNKNELYPAYYNREYGTTKYFIDKLDRAVQDTLSKLIKDKILCVVNVADAASNTEKPKRRRVSRRHRAQK